MNVRIIPILADNYCYLVTNLVTRECLLIDPAEPSAILPHLAAPAESAAEPADGASTASKLIAILCTHHHDDHAGGNQRLVETYRVPVYGGDGRVQSISHVIQGQDDREMTIGKGFKAQVLKTPGHTTSSVCYHFRELGAVFTGDTLFSAGCGRFFEGTARDMLLSLAKLAALPPSTLVYPGHEYTKKNLKFGLSVEPDNSYAKSYLKQVADKPITIPSRIADEIEMNPFLRTRSPTIQKTCDSTDELTVLAKLREMKDRF